MSNNPGTIPRLVQAFLNEMQTNSGKDLLSYLDSLLEELEEKGDPEINEMHLVENIYQFIAKYTMLKVNLEKYTKDFRQLTPGSKLFELQSKKDDDMFDR